MSEQKQIVDTYKTYLPILDSKSLVNFYSVALLGYNHYVEEASKSNSVRQALERLYKGS